MDDTKDAFLLHKLITRKWDAHGYIPARTTTWTDVVGGQPDSVADVEAFRQAFAALPTGLKAVIYRDLYREGMRVTDVESVGSKEGLADKYLRELAKEKA